MSEPAADRVVPVPMLDRDHVADQIRRRIRLSLHPVAAKAAVKGMPVDLTVEQSLLLADTTLAALAERHAVADIDGRDWLIKTNRDWQARNEADAARWRTALAWQRAATDRWRGTALTAWVWLFGMAGQYEFHWGRWSTVGIVAAGLAAGLGLRMWLQSRDKRKVQR